MAKRKVANRRSSIGHWVADGQHVGSLSVCEVVITPIRLIAKDVVPIRSEMRLGLVVHPALQIHLVAKDVFCLRERCVHRPDRTTARYAGAFGSG